MIDLHCHSTCSDGLLTPKALFEKAVQNGVRMLALTDHDTVEGINAFLAAKQTHPLQFIKGIELSSRWKKYDIHILGLDIDHEHAALTDLIEQQNKQRFQRAQQISERMVALGVTNAFEKARKLAGHERIARPHFAQVLVEEGKVTDWTMAFKRFLGSGKPAYVATAWISIAEAIEGIRLAGGQAILAHPLKYKLTRSKLHELIAEFTLAGGAGLEVVSGDMTKTEIQEVAGLCQRYNLLASTGSDYHGEGLSRVSLGCQKSIPQDCKPVWQPWLVDRERA